MLQELMRADEEDEAAAHARERARGHEGGAIRGAARARGGGRRSEKDFVNTAEAKAEFGEEFGWQASPIA